MKQTTVRRNQRWYQPEDLYGPTLPPVAPSGPTVPQLVGALDFPSTDEQVDRSIRWYQPDLGQDSDGPLRTARYSGGSVVPAQPNSWLAVTAGATAGRYLLNEPFNDATQQKPGGWYTSYDYANTTFKDFLRAQWVGGITNGRPSLIAGDPNPGMALDGTSAFMTGAGAGFSTNDFSVETFIATTASGTAQIIAADKISSLGTVPGWELLVTTTGKIQFTVRDGIGSPVTAATAKSYNDGLPHHILATRSAGVITVYVDNEVVTASGSTIDVTTTAPLTIGAYSSGTPDYFSGDIHNVLLYLSALTRANFTNHDVIARDLFAPMVQQEDWSESSDHSIRWYQPDAEIVTPVTTDPTRVTQDIIEVIYADANAQAIVSQGIVELIFALGPQFDYLPTGDSNDWSEQRSNAAFWYQPDTGAEFIFTPAGAVGPTVAQLAGIWQEQVEPTSTQPSWFAPEADEQAPTPAITQDANPLKQVDGPDEQVSRTLTWFAEDEAFWVAIPNETQATVAQIPVQQPSADEDVSRVQTWFQDEHLAWVSLANPSSVTTAQEPIQNPSADEDRDRSILWFQDETQGAWTPIPAITQATVAQEPIQNPDPSEDVDRTARWYQEPDDQLGIPPFRPSVDAFPLKQVDGPDEQVDRTQRWYEEPDDQLGAIPIVVTVATVAQQAALWPEQPGQEASLAQTWFAPDEQVWTPIPNLTQATVAQEPVQVDDPSEQASRSIVWFAEDEQFWVSLANPAGATTAQEPIQQPGADEDLDRSIRWFQDEHLAWVSTAAPSFDGFPLKQVDDWSESAPNGARWFAEDESFWTPIPGLTEPSVNQFPIQTDDVTEQRDVSVRWFVPDDDYLGIPPFGASVATVAQQPIQQPSADEDVDHTVRWFAEDAEQPWGYPPFNPSTATPAQDAGLWIDGSGQQDVSLAVTYYQPEDQWWMLVFSFITNATVPQQAALWPEQPQDWTAQFWFTPEESFDGQPPRVNAPTAPDYGYDPTTDRDQTILWFQDEHAAYVPTPAITEDANPLKQVDDPSEQVANGQRWFAEDEAFWLAVPGLTEPTVAQEPIQTDGLDEQADHAVRWFAPDDDYLGLPPFAPSTATTAQEAALWPEQPYPEGGTAQVWFAPEESYWTSLANPSTVSVAQEPIQNADPDEEFSRTLTWFAEDEAFWVPIPGLTVDAFPLKQEPDWSEQAANGALWHAPDAEQAPPYFTAQQVVIYSAPFGDQADLPSTTIVWFAPDASVEGLTPLANAPVAYDIGYDPATDLDLTVRWFAPDEQVWTPQPVPPTEAVVPQVDGVEEQVSTGPTWFQDEHCAFVAPAGASTGPTAFAWLPEQVEQQDLTQRWFTEPDDALGLPPFQPSADAFPLKQTDSLDEQVSRSIVWFTEPDDATGLVPSQPSTATVAQQAALWPEQPYPEGGNQPRWYQPEDPYENPLPLAYLPPTTPYFAGLNAQPDWSESADRTIVWFAPSEAEWTPIPNLTQATVPQRLPAEQAYEAIEQRDVAIRWYQPEDDYTGISPLTYNVTLGLVTATDSASILVSATDSAIIVTASDAASVLVTAADAAGILVTASDGPSVIVTATDV